MLPSATDAANQPSIAAPPTQQVKVNGMQVVWDSLRARGVSEKASTVILKSLSQVLTVLEISGRPMVPDDQKVYRVTSFW